jgi:hypothetical protein
MSSARPGSTGDRLDSSKAAAHGGATALSGYGEAERRAAITARG